MNMSDTLKTAIEAAQRLLNELSLYPPEQIDKDQACFETDVKLVCTEITAAEARIKELEESYKQASDGFTARGEIIRKLKSGNEQLQQTITEKAEIITALKISDKAQECKIDEQAAEIERLKQRYEEVLNRISKE